MTDLSIPKGVAEPVISCSPGPSWFCLRAAGRREHLAALRLTQRTQVEAFAPRIRVRRERRTGGVDTLLEGLFPGYLFARFCHPAQTRHVVSTAGVLGLVTFGGPPPALLDATIDRLRLHALPSAVAPAQVAPIFSEGDWVRVAAGCFRGSEGRVRECTPRQDRVCLLLSLLGHEVEISLPADHLIARSRQAASVSAALRPVNAHRPAFH
ncbi:MAG: transcription termination/antitermination NusG family protein [Opitutaceae bacterium]